MSKIVYLLGAGASAQAMPLVKDFNVRLKVFFYFLKNIDPQFQSKYHKYLLKDLAELGSECINHYSADTFAKKLFLTKSDQYNNLKAILTCFFIFESFSTPQRKNPVNGIYQSLTNPDSDADYRNAVVSSYKTIDLRYDALLAALLKTPGDLSLPKEVTFISWNYDDQLEFAAETLEKSLGKKQFQLNSLIDKIDSANASPSPANLIKLNGSYMPHIESIGEAEVAKFLKGRAILQENLNLWGELYQLLIHNPKLLKMNFAWEHNPETDIRIAKAKEIMSEATELVVIGYSFPNYNVEIDQIIFGNRPYNRVYIEDTPENYAGIVERLEYIGIGDVDQLEKDKKLRNHRDLKTFCLPPSFYGIKAKDSWQLTF